MRKSIIKWLKKHATIAKIGALLVFLGVFEEFVRGIQKDLDEVRYSREIIKLEKNHIEEIDENGSTPLHWACYSGAGDR